MLTTVLLGVIAGAWGALFTKGLDVAPSWFARVPGPRPLITMVSGAVLGLAVLALPELWGVGYEPITQMLHGEIVWTMLIVLLVALAWVQSHVRDPAQRELLYELNQAREKLLRDAPGEPTTGLVDKSFVNLVRMWSDV